jgi:hypothetical protein
MIWDKRPSLGADATPRRSYGLCQSSTAAAALLLAGGCGMRPLEGTIVGTNGRPIPDFAVTLEVGTNGGLQKSLKTSEVGSFSFGSVSTFGGCAIRLEKDGYETRKVPCPSDGSPLRVVMKEIGRDI